MGAVQYVWVWATAHQAALLQQGMMKQINLFLISCNCCWNFHAYCPGMTDFTNLEIEKIQFDIFGIQITGRGEKLENRRTLPGLQESIE